MNFGMNCALLEVGMVPYLFKFPHRVMKHDGLAHFKSMASARPIECGVLRI
jgi:hypothetical protein